jgi:hypothetical protein
MPLTEHEPRSNLPPEVIEQRRAMESLIEELEATMWYQERAAASDDESVRAILEHNRDEEIEHAMMLLEWCRRHFPGFEEQMKTYLFTTAPITEVEEQAEEGEEGGDAFGSSDDGSLNIGSLKGA